MVQNYTIYNVQVRIIENITKLNIPPNSYIAIISNENNFDSLPVRFMLYTRSTHWILPTLITDKLVRSLSIVNMQLALERGKDVYDTSVTVFYCIYCIHPFSHKCDIGHYIYKLHYILNI